ncbi:adenosylhomocysteinase [Longimycelium tulufanense]|uniref:Adenosylhomocysteinase n=1 Tax=Longimycelium tulufanense TaxID=907463 RepID=A0A8J3C8C6_9PSEU|nr:adenosylhomocysteinase [Longimycelium tulufanense]GGM53903.1 adenosylhomocysteinase [Longimycelium tulufanense]
MTELINRTRRAEPRLEVAMAQMPVLGAIREKFAADAPLSGHRLALCGHVTVETAVQVLTLVALGAEVAWCASSASTTDSDVAELIRDRGVGVHGWRGMSEDDLLRGARDVLATWPEGPTLVLDEGAVLITALHQGPEDAPRPVLATEKTPDGLAALDRLAARTPLRFPIIKSDESFGKEAVDNPHGTAQSLLETILAVSGRLLAGKVFVIAGYGRVGAGLAERARGLGARVIVTEVRPTRALLAALDGYDVVPMAEAAPLGDFFCTVTGAPRVLRGAHLARMRSGAVLANGGHRPWEIDLDELDALTVRRRPSGPGSEWHVLADGRQLQLIGGGSIANLSAGRGNASEVMDVTFASQVLALQLVLPRVAGLVPGLHPLPPECDDFVAAAFARALGITLPAETPDLDAFTAVPVGGAR